MTKWVLFFALLLAFPHAEGAWRIEHLEPASWWVGMKDPRLQLLVHGERIAELEPTLNYPGARIERVHRTGNPNYLFVDVVLSAEAAPGRPVIEFRSKGLTVLRHDYALQAREPGSADRKGFGAADVLYLITPDRFANGDPRNDEVAGYRERPNRNEPYGRHGGDLQGILDNLDYIERMGFTQIWLNPVLENDQPQASYHGYAITDFYRVDARFGDNGQFRALAQAARRRGIGMIMDVIPNHCGSQHWWMKDLPAPDWINHGGRFVGSDHNRETVHDPHGTQEDRRALTDGWFVPTMPDLNQRNPFLATYLVQNSLWWIEFAGLSGLRVDTWPYSDRDFLAAWTRRLLDEYPGLNVVGEEWSQNPAIVSHWQQKQCADGYVSHLPSLMDFPLQDALVRGVAEPEAHGAGLHRIYSVLANDFLYTNPYNLVVFPDNHDMNRLFTQLGERPELYRMAVALVATTRGIPQFYYGSELLKTSPRERHDGLIRSDFPGGWPGDRVNGFTGEQLGRAEKTAQEFTRALLNWRRTASAVHGGKLMQYVPRDGVYVYFRTDEKQKVMVAINKREDAQRLDTARFHEAIGSSTSAVDVLSRRKVNLADPLLMPGYGVLILELQRGTAAAANGGSPQGASALAAAGAAAPASVAGPAGVTGTLERHENFASRHVASRNVHVWLPASYASDAGARYPVLYMHDGQNLFDPALSYTGVDWGVDETMTRLAAAGSIREAIVVGIWNTPRRLHEYMPQKALGGKPLAGDLLGPNSIPAEQLASDAYLRFLVHELKPFVDARYRTLADRNNTFIMGSSMGALVSAYAVSEYPQVFGGAACVSTHWPIGQGIAIDYLREHLPPPGVHRFYFDHGTKTLDQYYEPYQQRMDAAMRARGYREGADWITRKYEGAEHNEAAWRARLDAPLAFLLKE